MKSTAKTQAAYDAHLQRCNAMITSLGTHLSCCVLNFHRNTINKLTETCNASPVTATDGLLSFVQIDDVRDAIVKQYPDMQSCALALGTTIAGTVFAFSGQGVRDQLEYAHDLPTTKAGITKLFNSPEAAHLRYLVLTHFGFPMGAHATCNRKYMTYV